MTNILCIDNSETIRKIVKDCVLDLGHNFFDAVNGQDGLQKVSEISDLKMIIMDWNMPVMSGRETLVKLRNTESLQNTIILVLVKVEVKDQVVEALELGATNYMLKPFSVNNLQNKIEELLLNAV